MRIALLTEVFLPKIDGVVTRTTRHLDQLAELGHEVLIFAPGNPPERYAGFEVVPIPSRSLKVYPEVMHGMMGPRAFRRLREPHKQLHLLQVLDEDGGSGAVAQRHAPVGVLLAVGAGQVLDALVADHVHQVRTRHRRRGGGDRDK